MGLTDREKEIIDQMERALASEDPRLVATMERNRPRILLNIIVIVAGIALVLTGVITKLVILGVIGFLIALIGAATIRISRVGSSNFKIKAPKGSKIQDRWDRRNK